MINATYLHLRAKVGYSDNEECPRTSRSDRCTAGKAEQVRAESDIPIQAWSEFTEDPLCEAVTVVPGAPLWGTVRPALTMAPL